jgi:hypothetical protein
MEPLSFDGVYLNVYNNRDILYGKDITLFVMGAYVGGDNSFNENQPFEYLCDWGEIISLCETFNCKLGFHSWTHRDLTTLNDEELKKEVTPPFFMKYFAYPHGKFDDRVIEAVRKAGYEEAWSVTDGDDSPYQRLRRYL